MEVLEGLMGRPVQGLSERQPRLQDLRLAPLGPHPLVATLGWIWAGPRKEGPAVLLTTNLTLFADLY